MLCTYGEDIVNLMGNYKENICYMPNKLTYEEAKKSFEDKGLILLDKEYINASVKMSFMNHQGYKAMMKLGNLRSGKNPCYFSATNPYTIENIQKFMEFKGSKTKILSTEFHGEKDKLYFKCGECEKIFTRTWLDLSTAIYCECKECCTILRGIGRRNSVEKIQKKFEEHNLKLLEVPYGNNDQMLECEDSEGYRGFCNFRNLLRDSSISRFDKRVNEKYFLYNVQHYADLNDYTCQMVGYADNQKWRSCGIKVQCECGNKFDTSLNAFRLGKFRCAHCAKSISAYEALVKNWLDKHKIPYIQQQCFEGCKDKIALPFDFYFPSKNMVIEVDGQGHYFVANFNQCSNEQAKISYELTVKHDKIKDKFCKDNNITIVRIPYWNMDNKKYLDVLTNIFK